MIYISNDFKSIFFINYKCCFSSFETLLKEGKIKRWNPEIKIKEDINFYIIIRHPLTRLLSFFNDKFISSINNDQHNKQISQITMCDFYNKDKLYSMKMTFSDFVNAIQRGYNDCHIIQQSNILKQFNVLNKYNKNINFIKLESKNFHKKVSSLIGYEFIQINTTKNMLNNNKKATINDINEKDLNYIYSIYKKDYTIFEYDKN